MALRLAVISENRVLLGSMATIVFGVGGGSIGRARDNDWVLPDPQRYVSAHHARVQFRHGMFFLFDTSSNGVYVNTSPVPLSRGGGYPLRNGDLLRLGEFEVAVSIDGPELADAPPPSSEHHEDQSAEIAAVSEILAEEPVDIRPVERSFLSDKQTADHLDVPLSLEDVLGDEAAKFGQFDPRVPKHKPPESGLVGLHPENSGMDLVPAETILAGPLPDAGAPPRTPASGARAATTTSIDGVDTLCRAAGIDPARFSAQSRTRVLGIAGQLLREALVGIKDLAVSQAEIRALSGLPSVKRDGDGPDLASLSVEDLLEKALQESAAMDIDSVHWLRATLAIARQQDVAIMQALRIAMGDYLPRLLPAEASDTAMANEQARLRALIAPSTNGLPPLFAEAFARAFAELSPPQLS